MRGGVNNQEDLEKLQLKAETLLATIQGEMTKDPELAPPAPTPRSDQQSGPSPIKPGGLAFKPAIDLGMLDFSLGDDSTTVKSELTSFEKDILSMMDDFGL
ncbi:hypothetical protein HDV03_002592 [Kappamyces sp. JEL0829]|nr:hypothetical protein HDV03_002592 [Kappamyces sp. JEL0829]